jgi:hypothetical protein
VKVGAPVVDEVFPPTVTVTSTDPAVPAGVLAVQAVTDVHVTSVAVCPVPKSKTVSPEVVENPVPVRVTVVPPAVVPDEGVTLVRVGAGVVCGGGGGGAT